MKSHNKTVCYCKRVNIEDFLKCKTNCVLSVLKNGDLPDKCIFGKDLKVVWEFEDTRIKNNLSCSKCSSKTKRLFYYGDLKFYKIYLWVCYGCGTIGFAVKDPFTNGTVMNYNRLVYLCEEENRQDLLNIINSIIKYNNLKLSKNHVVLTNNE